MSWRSNDLGKRWVHLLLSLFFFSFSLHFFLFQNKQQGSLGTDYSALHQCLSQPFSLLTNVQLQMVNDGILWNSLRKAGFQMMEKKFTVSLELRLSWHSHWLHFTLLTLCHVLNVHLTFRAPKIVKVKNIKQLEDAATCQESTMWTKWEFSKSVAKASSIPSPPCGWLQYKY